MVPVVETVEEDIFDGLIGDFPNILKLNPGAGIIDRIYYTITLSPVTTNIEVHGR
jgi:hypothetical protein